MMRLLLLLLLLLLAPALARAAPSPGLEERCHAWLRRAGGGIAAAARCRAELPPELCTRAQAVFGSGPWLEGRVEEACKSWGVEIGLNASDLEGVLRRKPLQGPPAWNSSAWNASAWQADVQSPTAWNPWELPAQDRNPWSSPHVLGAGGESTGRPHSGAQGADGRNESRSDSAAAPLAEVPVNGSLELVVVEAAGLVANASAKAAFGMAVAVLAGVQRERVMILSMQENWGKYLEEDGRPFIPGLCYVDVSFVITAESAAAASATTHALAATRLRGESSWEAAIQHEMRLAGLLNSYPVQLESARIADVLASADQGRRSPRHGHAGRALPTLPPLPTLRPPQQRRDGAAPAEAAVVGLLTFSVNDTASMTSSQKAQRAIEACIAQLAGPGKGSPTVTSVVVKPASGACPGSPPQSHECTGARGGWVEVYFVADAVSVEESGRRASFINTATSGVLWTALRSALQAAHAPFEAEAGWITAVSAPQMPPTATSSTATTTSSPPEPATPERAHAPASTSVSAATLARTSTTAPAQTSGIGAVRTSRGQQEEEREEEEQPANATDADAQNASSLTVETTAPPAAEATTTTTGLAPSDRRRGRGEPDARGRVVVRAAWTGEWDGSVDGWRLRRRAATPAILLAATGAFILGGAARLISRRRGLAVIRRPESRALISRQSEKDVEDALGEDL